MVQGDKYSLPITLKDANGNKITPDLVIGVKVKLGDYMDAYPDGSITYDESSQKWLVPLTQALTLSMKNIRCQAQVKFNSGEIFGSVPQVKSISEGIIKEEWT